MPPKIIKALETIELGAYGNDMSILQSNKTIEATLGNNKKYVILTCMKMIDHATG